VQTKDALDYVKGICKDVESGPNNYLDTLTNASDDMKQVLASMLEFNPFFRSSAREALKSKLFDSIRIHANERPANTKLKLEVDQDEAFDYKTGKVTKFTRQDYLRMIHMIVYETHAIRNFSIKLKIKKKESMRLALL